MSLRRIRSLDLNTSLKVSLSLGVLTMVSLLMVKTGCFQQASTVMDGSAMGMKGSKANSYW
jgi:hypothetical protein